MTWLPQSGPTTLFFHSGKKKDRKTLRVELEDIMMMRKKRPITSAQMALIEKRTERLGVPLELLMENAGAAVARLVVEKFPKAKRIALFCGTGNNGGDGFVAARHLSAAGLDVQVFLAGGEPGSISKKEARLNWKILRNLKGVKAGIFRAGTKIPDADVAVDALLGTGVHGAALREPVLSAVRLINSRSWKVVAVDTPSGLDPSTGEVAGTAVEADYTVTFHRMKTGLVGRLARKYTGKVGVAKIGAPKEADVF